MTVELDRDFLHSWMTLYDIQDILIKNFQI